MKAQARTKLISKWCKDLLEVRVQKALSARPGNLALSHSRYRGLQSEELSLFSKPGSKRLTIHYPHSTVRDFIKRKKADGTLTTMAGSNFDWSRICCRIQLRLTKSTSDQPSFSNVAITRMQSPAGIRSLEQHQIIELDRVGRLMKQKHNHVKALMENDEIAPARNYYHWSLILWQSKRWRRQKSDIFQSALFRADCERASIISLALHCGLHEFFLEEFDRN